MEEKKKLLQWHPAFCAGMQIELSEEAEHLTFEQEHSLGTKPMQIDLLIIKKDPTVQLNKNIGRIFRKHNILEYKDPKDYLSIDDFYKVCGYACFYKAEAERVEGIRVEEITLSFVCRRYPRKLVEYLVRDLHLGVEEQEAGIYYVTGGMFAMQLLVTRKLLADENLWLRSLTDDLKEGQETERLLAAYVEHERDKRYQSVMDVIVHANRERFKRVDDMCDALMEILEERAVEIAEEKAVKMAEEMAVEMAIEMAEVKAEEKVKERLDKVERQGRQNKLLELIAKKIAKGKSVAQIAEELEEEEADIFPLYCHMREELSRA